MQNSKINIDICEMNEELTDFEISIKGVFPLRMAKQFFKLEFINFKYESGNIYFTGSKEDLEKMKSIIRRFYSVCKIIEVRNHSEVLIEIGTKRSLKGDIESIFIFEVSEPKKRFLINIEEIVFLLKLEDKKRFFLKYPESFRGLVKKKDFNEIVKSNNN